MTASAPLGCDAGLIGRAVRPARPARGALVLAASILASSLAFVDGSVVNVGLPAIGASLRGGAGALQWVVNAYLLPLTALLLIGGALGDRFGKRRLLIAGIVAFAAASLACALAPNLPWLLAGRALQGVGAALLLPNSLAALGAAFHGPPRARAVGAWAAASAMASAIGPVLGGSLIDLVGWRAIFLVNLPLAAAAIALAWIAVRDASEDRAPTPLDLPGAVLATGALAAFTWGLTVGTGPRGWSVAAAGAVAVGAGLMLAFAAVEARAGDAAMTPPALFASRAFVGLNLMTLLLYGALGGFLTLLPYFLITDGGYSATAAGATLLPFPVVMALGAPLMGALAGRIGPRGPLTLGSFAAAGGLLLAMRIGAGAADYWRTVLPCVLVLAAGMAGAAAPLTSAVLGSVDERHTGLASGLNSAVARAGGLIATALIGQVLAARGERLAAEFRTAALLGAAAAAAAGLCAFLSLGASRPRGGAGRA